ncbi:MAG: primosomal protein N' [Kofleriaceae bacterium]
MHAGYCEVAVALPVAGLYTYAVPTALDDGAVVGARVLVPFGGRGISGVVVRRPAPAPPDGVAVRAISDLTGAPISPELVGLAVWLADYYEAPPGEALRLVQPVGSGESSTWVVTVTAAGQAILDGDDASGALPPRQARLLARVGASARPLARAELGRAREELAALVARGLLREDDARTVARTRGRREKWAALAVSLDLARAATSRAPARRAVVDAVGAAPAAVATLTTTLPGAAAAVRALAKAGVLAITERDVAPTAVAIGDGLPGAVAPPVLTDEQAQAVAVITGAAGFAAVLLHGVTGAGKTEVYLHAIATARAAGRGAIVLVPEISLTPQLAARFRARFGDEVAILHSGLAERDRLGEWTRLERGDARIAVGARSAVFAPVRDLGIIVVDEEHDGSFKQDEGVRYHGRDVALVRAQRAGCVCVLGSATPSLESYAAAQAGRYRLVELFTRPTGGPLPAVEIVDLKKYQADAEAMLSAPLAAALGEALATGDQAILFLNRRGFATFIMCKGCGHAFRCEACAVSLTYHQTSDRLHCHYCGHSERVPVACPTCGAEKIDRKGLGTERVAAAVAARFPAARVARLDRDVATGAKVEAVLSRVARREVDVLVGTQMVTKGHDFPGVTLVGVLLADLALGLPDFRAAERTFQLLTQVAGRAGRGHRPGRVLIQTYQPTADAVVCAAGHDYAAFYAAESVNRAELDYPPSGRVCAVRIDGRDPARVADAATRVATLAEAAARTVDAEVTVRGPTPAPLARLRGRTRWQVWLRSRDRAALRRVIRSVLAVDAPGVTVAVDVDPLSTL